MIERCRLPKKTNDHCVPNDIRWNGVSDKMEYDEKFKIMSKNNIEYTKKQYEKMEIAVLEEVDDLFFSVYLPNGWKIEATDHHMWNNIFDDNGRKRGSFFYKAAFYDRDAFTNFNTRYHAYVAHVADSSEDYENWSKSDFKGTIKDGEEIIFETQYEKCTGDYGKDDKVKEKLKNVLDGYMEKYYPYYQDINAYWN